MAISEGGEKYTEFYILGSAGKAENYPTEIVLGEEARVIIGIVNREREDTSYLVEVMIDKVTSVKIGPIMLADEEEWEKEVSFIPTRIGEDQKVEFALHRGEQVNPYLTLHLWLNVKAP